MVKNLFTLQCSIAKRLRLTALLETEVRHIKVAITPYFSKSEGRVRAAIHAAQSKGILQNDEQTVSYPSDGCASDGGSVVGGTGLLSRGRGPAQAHHCGQQCAGRRTEGGRQGR